jgi:tetratricopeptide (TPR) repeat protein
MSDFISGAISHSQHHYEHTYRFERALKIREASLGPGHRDVATLLNNLAGVYDDQCRYGKACDLFRRALKILESTLGPDHPEVAFLLNNLGTSLNNKQDFQASIPVLQRAVEVMTFRYGASHRNVQQVKQNLLLARNSANKKGGWKGEETR